MAQQQLPTLYYYVQSFYSQKARLYLAEKQVEYNSYIVDNFNNETYQPFYMKMNPDGKVPLLKDGELFIPESSDIIKYIENKYEQHVPMLPSDEEARKRCLELWEILDAINIPLLSFGSLRFPQFTKNCQAPMILRKFGSKYGNRSEIFKKLMEKYPQHRNMYEKKLREWQQHEGNFCSEKMLLDTLSNTDVIMSQLEDQLSLVDNEFPSIEHWLLSKDFLIPDVILAVTMNRLYFLGFAERFWGQEAGRPHLAKYFKQLHNRETFQDICLTRPSFWNTGLPLIKKLVREALPWNLVFSVVAVAALTGFSVHLYKKQ